MISKWQENELTIDGSKQDWGYNLRYLKDEKVAIGITNDEQNLYLCLVVSENEKIMNILRSGFTIWIDPQNSDAETFGIQYPIKRISNDVREFSKKTRILDMADRKKYIINKLLAEQDEFLILNQDKYSLSAYSLNNNIGIEVKIGIEMNQLVYELKIPLTNKKDSLIKFNVQPNDEIKLGFLAEVPQRLERGNRQGRDRPGRGRGGKRGVMSGREQPQKNRGTIEPINFWINTIVASN